jgi:hypothetical protein
MVTHRDQGRVRKPVKRFGSNPYDSVGSTPTPPTQE